ncbi:DUF6986 family protein [Corynebacterium heidelbergense]|uniref:Aldolase n=1 Tax=Corynebacterium heidelbergense TaxID=2055947 RepID=A0A364VEK8_9CORY|nr:hypothetical protein [Corynebacterium heidelbergense]RAV35058.1 hypothetical protein CWC39_00125 [Corynebacterium heidelbergense]
MSTALDKQLAHADNCITQQWSTAIVWRQPIHTVYVPAHWLVGEGAAPAGMQEEHLSFRQPATDQPTGTQPAPHQSTPEQLPAVWANYSRSALTAAFGTRDLPAAVRKLAGELQIQHPAEVAQLTAAKLNSQPIEDLRIDFEDGFTQRHVAPENRDADEDHLIPAAAAAVDGWLRPGGPAASPTFAGIRFKSFDPGTRRRGIRTFSRFLTELHERGTLAAILDPRSPDYAPRALRLTFPKVQHPDQVRALVGVLQQVEERFGLAQVGARIPFEIQVETPQAILGEHGAVAVTELIEAAEGRCLSMHYGTYDYSAYLGVDATYQSLAHPVADAAKGLIQIACTGRGVELSDGSTNRIPVGGVAELLPSWRNHRELVTRHLQRGIRQGWDLHPNQLVTRHLATIEYFRVSAQECIERTRDYVRGDTTTWMDEPATAKAMAGYLVRAHDCGAITPAEFAETGVSMADMQQLRATGRLDFEG